MNSAIVDAGTKCLAISLVFLAKSLTTRPFSIRKLYFHILLVKMPRRHFLSARKTPDPDPPAIRTSLMKVLKLVRYSDGSNCGDIIRERAVPYERTIMTFSPAFGGSLHSGFRRNRRLTGRRSSFTDRSARSIVSNEPSLMTLAGSS